jgi:hypothetical protein
MYIYVLFRVEWVIPFPSAKIRTASDVTRFSRIFLTSHNTTKAP